jgi:hypothetical protein
MVSPIFDLSKLDGTNGFTINGIAAGDDLGYSVSRAGDVNGDGIDDIIVAADEATANGNANAGQSYVIFGSKTGFPATFTPSALNGINGFTINGIAANDYAGTQVSNAGDVNGDGIGDLIIGAYGAKANGNASAGQSYVVFGSKTSFPATLNLSALNGSNGFTFNGIAANNYAGDSVSSAGDVNGDGIDDLVIGADGASPNGNNRAGQSYVVFGSKTGFPATLNLSTLNGVNGFTINGIAANDGSGYPVSSAGDVNGDGIDDLIIGASSAKANGNAYAGQSYVVFGSKTGFPATLNLSTLNGVNGFTINGIAANDSSGYPVRKAGDINGDGIGDLVIGADGADPNGNSSAGQSYVVFGSKTGFPATLNLSTLNGTNGFTINGIAAGDFSGSWVSGAGDVNGDGIDDLIVGAYDADVNGKTNAGQSYVIYGSKTGFPATLNLSVLNGSNGFTINGIAANDFSGYPVEAAGDVNGDGVDDLLIGADGADPNGNSGAGQSYVVYGVATPIAGLNLTAPTVDATGVNLGSINVDLSAGTLVINSTPRSIRRQVVGFANANGTAFDDSLIGNSANNVLVGNAGNDVIVGNAGNDTCLGGLGNDSLSGGDGNDLIAGGAGNDTLTGGANPDRFLFDMSARFNRSIMGVDTITDFSTKQDKIVLDRTTFTTLKSKLKFESVKTVAEAKTSDAQIVYVRKTAGIYYNPNGDHSGFGFGGLFATVTSGLNLTAKSFSTQA